MELTAKDKAELLRFKTGFPWMDIVAPATPSKGIKVLSENEVSKAVETAEKALSLPVCNVTCRGLKFAKFVPASGAASRMFKDLLNKNVIATNKFVSNIDKFAFYDKSIYADINGEALVDFTLGKGGLDYASKPKGVLKFHKYEDEVRTAIAEHLVEAARYMKNSEGQADLVITISPEHQSLFDEAIAEVKSKYENKYGVSYNIKTVFQYKWTDTIAVTPEGEPFLTDDGTVLHRPGGHGALINNLNEVDADVVSIKNIDNVSVESYLPMTAKWKRVLIGTALLYREEINNFIKRLNTSASNDLCAEIESFLKDELCIGLPTSYSAATVEEKVKILYSYLHRPIRVCGMVKNEGEPGGGPFLVREKDGGTSLQILEGVQINQNDAHAVECLKSSTHFNPVDLVCVLTDENGRHYNLLEYVDEDAGFISSKSYQGRDLRALELPGLWNGSMSRWNTVFVEVPIETFNPVKTVLDLLRPAHQAR
ncbi:MAG: DUF4301 family protein [Bacteroidales bacterium]|nr:DUF4301 family protein [Bacteroidales bacterium]